MSDSEVVFHDPVRPGDVDQHVAGAAVAQRAQDDQARHRALLGHRRALPQPGRRPGRRRDVHRLRLRPGASRRRPAPRPRPPPAPTRRRPATTGADRVAAGEACWRRWPTATRCPPSATTSPPPPWCWARWRPATGARCTTTTTSPSSATAPATSSSTPRTSRPGSSASSPTGPARSAASGRMRFRMRDSVFPGDTMILTGSVDDVDDRRHRLRLGDRRHRGARRRHRTTGADRPPVHDRHAPHRPADRTRRQPLAPRRRPVGALTQRTDHMLDLDLQPGAGDAPRDRAQPAAPSTRRRPSCASWRTTRSGYPVDLWKQLAALDLLGLLVPEDHGGSGMSLLEGVVLYEELGRALAPTPHFVSCVASAGALAAGGSDGQQAEWLPQIASGDGGRSRRRGSSPTAASARGVRTQATSDDGGETFTITGSSVTWRFAAAATPPGRARPHRRRRRRHRPVPRRPAGRGRDDDPAADRRLRHPVPRRPRRRARHGRRPHRRTRERLGDLGGGARRRPRPAGCVGGRGRRPDAGDDGPVRQGPRAVRQADRRLPVDRPLPGRRPGRARRRAAPSSTRRPGPGRPAGR